MKRHTFLYYYPGAESSVWVSFYRTPVFRPVETWYLLTERTAVLTQVPRRLAFEDTYGYFVTPKVFGESPRTLGRDCHGVVLPSPDLIVAL